MNKNVLIIDDDQATAVAVALSREIANEIEHAVLLADNGDVEAARQALIKLQANTRYQPMVGVVPNGNVKLVEHPVIQAYVEQIANTSRFGEAHFSRPLNGRLPWTPSLKTLLDPNDLVREVHGLRIIIENKQGSLRTGYNNGKYWEVRMPADYGYVSAATAEGTEFGPVQNGADGDGVDCWLGTTSSDQVFIIDQRDLNTGKFDEHKCFVNFADKQDAVNTYKSAYNDGRGGERIMGVKQLTLDQFKEWLKSAKTKKRVTRKNLTVANEGEGHPFRGNQWTRQAQDPKNDPPGHPEGKLRHAVLVIKGKRYKGPSHFQAYLDYMNKSGDFDAEAVQTITDAGQGFETLSGHFLNRLQAARYVGSSHQMLTSEETDMATMVSNGQLYTQDPLLAANTKTPEQKLHDQVRDRIENIYRDELQDAVDQAQDALNEDPENESSREEALALLVLLLGINLRTAAQRSYKGSLTRLGSSRTRPAPGTGPTAYEKAAASFADLRAEKLQNAISKVRSTVSTSIQRGLAGGESADALRRRIQEGFDKAKVELDLVAETETQIVYGSVQNLALQLAGFTKKVWVTQDDERVRPSHTACEHQGAIVIGATFTNGLRFPGDPNGPASEVINCRCYLQGIKDIANEGEGSHPHAGRPGHVGGSTPKFDHEALARMVSEELKRNPLPSSKTDPVEEALEKIEQRNVRENGLIRNPLRTVGGKTAEEADAIDINEIKEKGRREEVEVDKLFATQTEADPKKLKAIVKSGFVDFRKSDPVLAVELDGKIIIADGNHRASAASLLGQKSISVIVYRPK